MINLNLRILFLVTFFLLIILLGVRGGAGET